LEVGLGSHSPPEDDPDVQLMLRVRDDDAEAFAELVASYQPRLARILQHLVGERELAEDLVQEVFLRVYRARKTYLPGAKFSTWIFRIANNIASNAVRDRSRRREYQMVDFSGSQAAVPAMDQLAVASSSTLPVRRLEGTERAEMVRQALDSLSERQRMALLLSKFEGLSYQEIADTMGLTTKAVRSLLSRSRENLRLILQPYMERGVQLSDEEGGADERRR
jgi:RNA polymerase sigma-70 factor (ECF subfamily)